MRKLLRSSGVLLSTCVLLAGCSESPQETAAKPPAKSNAESPSVPQQQNDDTPTVNEATAKTDESSAESTPPSPPSTPPKNLADAEVSLTIPADEFTFEKFTKAMFNENKGKVIETIGVVRSYEINFDATPILHLDKNYMEFASQPGSHAVFRAMPGQTVTLRQWINPQTSFDLWQAFHRWTIVKIEGPQPQTVDALTVAKDFANDQQAAIEKYLEKYFIITGTVHQFNDDGPRFIVTLTPEDVEPKVVAEYTPYGETVSPKEWVQEGKDVKVLAKFFLEKPEVSDALALPPEDKTADK
ncbi:hypothetical protein [Thalassoroseus pseudoceratinae]|uniref:hypothetical protein n=1 Tax=Thalassoroseus pseudoceratinae TaxID=2713176 RepID=UPI00141DA58D|nr:hypothetical protein [Thalassoroseus pseudoceratinae]